MNIIHTADIHLDACFAGVGATPGFGNRRRRGLRDVFRRILERAVEWPADAVLIAGDLLEHDRVTHDTIAFLREAFAKAAPVPIFIAPGNHDPYTASSAYATAAWPENVHIFSKPAWSSVALEGMPLTVHGFAFDGYEISSNPYGDLEIPEDGRCHIAVAHGSEREHQPSHQKSYAPFDAAGAAPPQLAYLALGHFHAVTPIKGEFNTTMYYSGTPEGHNFNETGQRYYLEIEMVEAENEKSASGWKANVTPVPSATTIYSTHELDCGEFTNSNQLVEALRSLAPDDGRVHVARCTLTGLCEPSVKREIDSLPDVLNEVYELLCLVDNTHPHEAYDELAREDTSLGVFVEQMNKQIKDAPDDAVRAKLTRARELGLAAYRGRELPVRGIERMGR